MWSVLRRYQGEEYSSNTDFLDANAETLDQQVMLNQRSIARHETKHYAKPLDPLVLTQPYGNFVYDKLIRHMSHENVIMRRKAVLFVLELFGQKGEHACAAVKEGMIPALAKCLTEDDEDVRTYTCVALQYIASQPVGQKAIMDGGHIPEFVEVLNDSCLRVVVEGLKLLCTLDACHNGNALTKELVKLGCIKKYVVKARSRDDEICAMSLAALNKVFEVKEAFIEVLDCDGMSVLTEVLAQREDPAVMIEASDAVGKLGFYSAGKRAAVRLNTIKHLVPLINHEEVQVRVAASGAVLALTVSEQGKSQGLLYGLTGAICRAVDTEDDIAVTTNIVKTLCNMSEHPDARKQLVEEEGFIEKLESLAELAGEEEPVLRNSVIRAISMIKWKPGDVY